MPNTSHTLTTDARFADRYRLVRLLGEGSTAHVWEARDERDGARVALKIATDPAHGRARIAREAAALGCVKDPHVVRLVHAEPFTAAPYLALECLDGRTLADEMRDRGAPFSIGELCELLRPVAAALDAVHAAGFAHLDVKPSNVVRAGERAVLVDFGIARAVAAREGERRYRRSSGDIAVRCADAGADSVHPPEGVNGTPLYLAPEVALGARGDGRADIYALACMAFEMLAGRAPHERASSLGAITAKITEPAPRLRDVAGGAFPDPLEALFARALSRDSSERPARASAFVRDLVRIAEGRAPSASGPRTPAPIPHRAAPPSRGWRRLWTSVAATVGLAGSLAWAWS